MGGLFYIIGGFVVFLAVATIIFQWRTRQHRGVSREEFVREFESVGVPKEIPTTVYDYYKRSVVFKDFGVSPDDVYESVLLKGEEDIDDDARFLMKRLGFTRPHAAADHGWDKRIQTLMDMVLWLNWVRQNQEGAI
jgi:hypothetical protein